MRTFLVHCGILLLGCSSAVAWGADGPSGVAGSVAGKVGGAVGAGSSLGGALPDAARLRSSAGINIRGSADAGGGRTVGPNFNAARLGVGAGLGASAGRSGLRVGGSAAANLRAEGRRQNERQEPASRPSAEREPSNYSKDPRVQAAMRADLSLANRLAEIDRLRDIALAKGDTHMLMRADALEGEARLQHEHLIRESGAEFGAATSARARLQRDDAAEFGQETAERARHHGRDGVEFGVRTSERAYQRGDEAAQFGESTAERAHQRGRDASDSARSTFDTGAEIRGSASTQTEGDFSRHRQTDDENPPRDRFDARAVERARFEGAIRSGQTEANYEGELGFEARGRIDERSAGRNELTPVSSEERFHAESEAEAEAKVQKRASNRETKRSPHRPGASNRTNPRER